VMAGSLRALGVEPDAPTRALQAAVDAAPVKESM